MHTLTLDDATYEAFEALRKQAAEHGYSVGEWIRIKLAPAEAGNHLPPDQLSVEEFQRRLDEFRAGLKGCGDSADYSRDAIYD